VKHEVLNHSTFFEHMEEFGYFRDLEELLPEDFTAVFEIARVLEDQTSELFRTLSPALTVTSQRPVEDPRSAREWRPNRNVMHGEEYEAALMRSVSDIKRIFPHQYLLPDAIFMQRLARRSLWINIPKTPITLPYKSSGRDYAPNDYKQKVYLLLDTSTSMKSHHRYQMAKAVVYVFLKRNLSELGHIYLRTFDTKIGPLQTATDEKSLRGLIHYAMRLNRMGNGTLMERALLQAAEDIRAQSELSGAEILMVTDGASHLDVDRIREALGTSIRINTVKIGNASLRPDEKVLRELAGRGAGPQEKELVRLEEDLRRSKIDLQNASTEADQRRIRSHIASIERRCEELRASIVNRLRTYYGREIELLSSVYVNVDDISADAIFHLTQSEIDEIRSLMTEVESDFAEDIDADSLREAALLYEHVQMLMKETTDPEQMRQLRELSDRLKELLKDLHHQSLAPDALMSISRSDIRDLQMMLHLKRSETGEAFSLIIALLRRLLRRIFR
jgi:hypothetical protein